MSREIQALLAGFGGQGILFTGKIMATAGLIEDRYLSWLPSYGPEMRGGTANCSVCLSDDPIGSPLVLTPNVLMAMNQPSYDKFIDTVAPGGIVVVDSVLVPNIKMRDDVTICPIPATRLADERGFKSLANVILVGKILRETQFCSEETIRQAIEKCVPPRKAHLLPLNLAALEIGMNYAE